MSGQVFVFSTDRIRGGILKKIFLDNQIRMLLVRKIVDVKETLSSHDPRVVIFDIHNCLNNEVIFLNDLVYSIKESVVILLGDSASLKTFTKDTPLKLFFFPDPFDPEKIAAKSREILASPVHGIKNREQDAESLENDLKQYLKL